MRIELSLLGWNWQFVSVVQHELPDHEPMHTIVDVETHHEQAVGFMSNEDKAR